MVLQDSPHCHAPIHPPAPVPTPSAHPALPLAIIKGAPTVLIGGMPAARLSDTTAPCVLPGCVPGGPGWPLPARPRGAPGGGAAEPVLRALLTPGGHPASVPGLLLVAEQAGLPWRVRLHDHATMDYRVHLVVARREGCSERRR
jgi:hypothetical protein